MATTVATFDQWLTAAKISPERLTAEQRVILQRSFHFRQQRGGDYFSTRLLSHFLLHCGSGLKIAQIARLLALSRPTASRQQGLSSKEVIQKAHHRLAGRSHGKLLPRYAGPIAEFVLTHTDATHYDTLDFIERTWDVRVSTVALYKFLKKYGLDRASRQQALAAAQEGAAGAPEHSPTPDLLSATVAATVPPGQPLLRPAPPFCSGARTMPGPFC